MTGELGEARGIIPRTFEYIFEKVNEDEKYEYEIKLAYVQLYLEEIYDLLDTKKKEIKLKTDISGNKNEIENIKWVDVKNSEESLNVFNQGNKNRKTEKTNMNKVSSRSHAILICRIIKKENTNGGNKKIVTDSRLFLVDLAGSERQSKTGAKGERFEEAKKINLSLSALGKCIKALSEKSSHIPYRDSKLTRIIQDALGGNCKTSLIVNLSPSSFNFEETYSSLLFADRATKIKNQAKRNEILDDKALCIKLQEELKRANEEIIRLQKENDKYKKENTKLKHTLSSLEQQTQVNQIPILTDDNNSDMDDSNIKQIKKNQQNDKKLIINQFSEEEIFDKKSKKTKGKQNEAFNIESYIKSIEDSYEEKLKKIEKERDEIANNFTNLLADNKTIIEKQSQQINQLHLKNDSLQDEINSLKKEKETIKQMIMEATSSLGELNFLDSIKNIKIQMEDLRRQNSILKQNNSLDIDIQTKYIKDIENNITKQESDKNEINIQLNEISSKLNLNDSASSFQTKEDSSQIENQTSKKSLNSKVKKERKNLERKYSELLTILKQIDSDIKMNTTICNTISNLKNEDFENINKTYITCEKISLDIILSSFKSKIENTEEIICNQNNSIVTLNKQLNTMKKEMNSKIKEKEKASIEEINNLKKENEEFTEEIKLKENIINKKDKMIKTYQKEIKQLQDNIEQKEEQITLINNEKNNQYINNIDEKNKQISQLEKDLSNMKALQTEMNSIREENKQQNQTIIEKENLISSIEQEKQNLEIQLQTQEDSITQLQKEIRIYQNEIQQLENQIDEFKEQQDIFENQNNEISKLTEKISNYENELNVKKDKIKKLDLQLTEMDFLREENKKLLADNSKIKSFQSKYEQDIKSKDEQITELKTKVNEIELMKIEKNSLIMENSDLKAQFKELELEIEKINKEKQVYEDKINILSKSKEENGSLQGELNKLKFIVQKYENDLKEKDKQIECIKLSDDNLEKLKNEINSLKNENNLKTVAVSDLENQIEEKDHQYETLQKTYDNLKQYFEEFQQESENLKEINEDKIQSLNSQIQLLTSQLNESEDQINQLFENLSSEISSFDSTCETNIMCLCLEITRIKNNIESNEYPLNFNNLKSLINVVESSIDDDNNIDDNNESREFIMDDDNEFYNESIKERYLEVIKQINNKIKKSRKILPKYAKGFLLSSQVLNKNFEFINALKEKLLEILNSILLAFPTSSLDSFLFIEIQSKVKETNAKAPIFDCFSLINEFTELIGAISLKIIKQLFNDLAFKDKEIQKFRQQYEIEDGKNAEGILKYLSEFENQVHKISKQEDEVKKHEMNYNNNNNIYDEISEDEKKPKKKKTHKKGKLSHNKKGKEGSLPKNVFEKSTKSFSEKEDL